MYTYVFIQTTNITSTSSLSYEGSGTICRGQTGGVLGVLAAMCSIGETHQALNTVFDLYQSNSAQHSSKDEARNLLQQMGVCFSSELARLATHDSNCKAFAIQHVQKLLSYLVMGLVDSDTLSMFPTSNLSLLSELDGHSSRSKGNDVLSKVQNHKRHDPDHEADPDQEAYKIKRRRGDYFDTAGPSYNIKNIWSFCENIGHLLVECDTIEHANCQANLLMKSIGNDIVTICKELRSDKDLLELLPQVSVERECLKRLLFFRALFEALHIDEDNHLDEVMGDEGGLFSLLSSSLIENLYYLSGIELELQEQQNIGCTDANTRYQRVKAFAFQRAYIELCGAVMTSMLRENIHWEGTDTCNFVRNNLIPSTFKGNLDLRRTIELSAKNLNLYLRKKDSSKGKLDRMPQDLLDSFVRRTDDLLVYAAGCTDNFKTVLFNAMFLGLPLRREATMIDTFIETVSRRLVLTSEAIKVGSTVVCSGGLERAVDESLLCAEDFSNDEIDQEIFRLRDWAMGDFFTILLNGENTTTFLKCITLELLTCILKTFSSDGKTSRRNIYATGGNLTSVMTYMKLFHSFKECMCISIRSGTAEATLIVKLFLCASQFLALPISERTTKSTGDRFIFERNGSWSCDRCFRKFSISTYDEALIHECDCMEKVSESDDGSTSSTLLQVARAASQGKRDGYRPLIYIYEVSVWLHVCGKLLQKQESTAVLHTFLNRMKQNESSRDFALTDTELKYLKVLCSSFNELRRLEKEMYLVKDSSLATNPYAKKLSNSGSQASVANEESLKAIEEFGKCLGAGLPR